MSPRIAVVVPAADEQDTIADCLGAILRAIGAYSGDASAVVVTDGCRDATVDIVRDHPDVTLVQTEQRNVGDARRIGTARALPGLAPGDLIASTDADTHVPVDWLVRAAALSASADLVLGTVVPGPGLDAVVERAWYREHVLRDGHPYVHGANLFIRAAAYRQLGGWRSLSSGEDVDLAARATAAGLRVLATAALPVRTSSRPVGRAPHGFSHYLRTLGPTPIPADPR